jgi:hypothetical protein
MKPKFFKKEKIIRKSKMFSFRLSEADYQRIHAKAERSNLTMTAFITTAALGKKIVIVEGFDKSIAELKAIGRNLNQLTTLCNMGKIQALELGDIKRQFGRVTENIAALKAS